jgi:hypothetical protein
MRIEPEFKNRIITIWWKKGNRSLSIRDFRLIRKKNKAEYPDDPDINKNRAWGKYDNGAKRGNLKDSCYDVTYMLGHIEINYTNFAFNSKM